MDGYKCRINYRNIARMLLERIIENRVKMHDTQYTGDNGKELKELQRQYEEAREMLLGMIPECSE